MVVSLLPYMKFISLEIYCNIGIVETVRREGSTLGCLKTPFLGQMLCPVFGPGHLAQNAETKEGLVMRRGTACRAFFGQPHPRRGRGTARRAPTSEEAQKVGMTGRLIWTA